MKLNRMDKKTFDKQLTSDCVNHRFKIENNYIVFDNSSDLTYKVLPNFTLGELLTKNPLASYTKLNKDLLLRLQSIREKLGEPIHINSSYRSPEYNMTVPGSAADSLHTKGDAIDCGFADTEKLSKVIKSFGYKGELGIYNSFCHIGIGHVSEWDKRSDTMTEKVKEIIQNDGNRNILALVSIVFFFLFILWRIFK